MRRGGLIARSVRGASESSDKASNEPIAINFGYLPRIQRLVNSFELAYRIKIILPRIH